MAHKKIKTPSQPSLYANPGTLLFYVEAYNAWRKMKAQSEHTVKRDTSTLLRFISFCEERGLQSPHEVTRMFLERYQKYLSRYLTSKGKELSVRAQLSYILSVRGYFRFLSKQRIMMYNPAADLDLPRLGKRLPRHVLTEEEAERVLAQTEIACPIGLRDRAMLEVLYSTGIRRLEIVNLKLVDIDLEGRTVFIFEGKGKKDRMIPIGARAVLWVKKYLAEARPRLAISKVQDKNQYRDQCNDSEQDSGFVFLTNAGEYLSANYLTELVQKYVEKSGIGKSGSCHLFRHTMATLMLDGGADIRYVQAMLGHSQLSTTEIYTHVSIRKLKEVHDRTHPAKTYRTVPLPHDEPKPEEAKTLLHPPQSHGSWLRDSNDQVVL